MHIINKGLIASLLTHQCFTCYLSSSYCLRLFSKAFLKISFKLKQMELFK